MYVYSPSNSSEETLEDLSKIEVYSIGDFFYKWRYMNLIIQTNTFGINSFTQNDPSQMELEINNRALQAMFYELRGLDMKYVFELINRPEMFPEFKTSIVKLLTRLEPATFTLQVLIDRFRTMDNMQLRMREMYCGMISLRLKYILKCIENTSTVIGWRVPVAEFVDNYELKIQFFCNGVLVICKEEYSIKDNAEIGKDYLSIKSMMMTAETAESIRYLNWSMIHQTDYFVCPAAYTFTSVRTVMDLLEILECFQHRVNELKCLMDSNNFDFIIFLCCAILDKANSFVKDISQDDMYTLFDGVYSILNFILPQVFLYKDDCESKELLIEECTTIFKLSSAFKSKFIRKEKRFIDYLDILFKYVVVVGPTTLVHNPLCEASLFFKWQKSVAFVYRKYLPNDIDNHLQFWRLKFSDLSNLEEVIREAEPKPMCTICGKKFDESWKTDEMAILERCNHLYCAKCLMGNINKVSDKFNSRLAKETFFKCPQPKCLPMQASFILGKDYSRLRALHLRL